MSDLLERTVTLLRESNERPRDIAQASGVGYEWLVKFARGVINDPGVKRIQRLHDYLSTKRTEAA